MEHPDPRLLSAFLEGELSEKEGQELEEHLDSCSPCAALLQDLKDIIGQANSLPDRYPARDLWPEISQAIRKNRSRDPDVIHLHPGGTPLPRPERRVFHLSLPQAVAAGLALALFSGLVGARIGNGGAEGPVMAQVEGVPSGSDFAWVSQVGEADPDLEATALQVAHLEDLLAEHRGDLDPLTAEILKKNLGVIDKAIAESVAALRADPGNLFLESNLERALLAKGDYLRDATLLVTPIS